MPKIANSKMKLEDFLLLWGQNVVGSQPNPNVLRKHLEALKKTILEEIELNGEIYIFEFGTFLLENKKGGDRRFNNVSTGMVEESIYHLNHI